GRIVYPRRGEDNKDGLMRNPSHLDLVEKTLEDSRLGNLHFDISWDAVAKYIVATPESINRAAELINRYPDRFLFGTDVVAPKSETYYDVYAMYEPLWDALTPEAERMIKLTNYERIFDEAREKVAAWERKNTK
ncbi:MAG: amidohydrolase, partial [Verrucomicrobia bacterium]